MHAARSLGHAGDGHGGLFGEVAQVLAHLVRPGGAVQADGVDAERLEGGERGADLGAHQHGASGFDGHRNEDREADAAGDDGLLAAVNRGLGLQEVLAGFDEESIRAAVDEALGLEGEGLLEVVVAGVAEAGELGARPHRAQDTPHPSVCFFCRFGAFAGDLRTLPGELFDAVVDAVVREVGPVGAEGVGFHSVNTHREVRVMDVREDIRAGVVEDLVATLQPQEICLERQLPPLQHGSHGAIGNDHPVVHGVQEFLGANGAGHGLNIKRETGHLNRVRAGAGTLRCVSVYYGGGVPFTRMKIGQADSRV